jgi:hypothetical protein
MDGVPRRRGRPRREDRPEWRQLMAEIDTFTRTYPEAPLRYVAIKFWVIDIHAMDDILDDNEFERQLRAAVRRLEHDLQRWRELHPTEG